MRYAILQPYHSNRGITVAIEMNIFESESIAITNHMGASGSKWVKIVVRDVHNQRHEIHIIPANNERNMAFFIGCDELEVEQAA